jgi:hypothetical protein
MSLQHPFDFPTKGGIPSASRLQVNRAFRYRQLERSEK